jgi:hypothetical protein
MRLRTWEKDNGKFGSVVEEEKGLFLDRLEK